MKKWIFRLRSVQVLLLNTIFGYPRTSIWKSLSLRKWRRGMVLGMNRMKSRLRIWKYYAWMCFSLWEFINVSIIISSGFRSFVVNAAVGGRYNSQHLEGKAADFTVPGKDLKEVFEMIRKHFSFDQLIYEFEKWIHVSWNGEGNRNEVLISRKVFGVTKYEKV